MASQAAAFLIQAGILPAIKPVLWDTSPILSEHSLLGEMLHTLIGYDDRPAAMQFLVYAVAVVIIGTMTLAASKPINMRAAGLTAVIVATITIVTMFLIPAPAHATHKVYYPTVEEGETELEVRGHTTIDSDSSLRNEQKYKIGVGRGFNSFWFSELYGEVEKPAGVDNYEMESFEWENLFQLTEQGKYWADWGFLVEYSKARESGEPDKTALTPIMQKQLGRDLATLNLTFEKESGDNAADKWQFAYAWQYRWQGNRKLEYGVEGYGELGDVSDWNSSSDQVHQVGPAIFGKLKTASGHAWKYAVGLLAGLTSSTPSATVTGLFEYEF